MFEFLKRLFRRRSAAPPAEDTPLRAAVAGRRRVEVGLRESEEQFAQLVAGVRDYAVFLLDRQGNVRTWNAGAERIKGYRPEEIIGQHFSRFYPSEAVASGWPAHELSVATATGRFEDEGWRVRKDGTRFWANVVITAVRDEAGQSRGFLKITRDLTDRKQAEVKLRLSEERFRLMVEGVKDYAIFMLDPQGHVATWNAGAQRLKGYAAEEIIGQHFSRFYPQEAVGRGWPDEELRRATADGRFEDEGWRVHKDGSQFWANVVITALRDEGGTLRGFAKVTRDLTQRRQAEESTRRLVQEEAARKAAEEAAQEIERQREQLHVTLSSIGDAVIVTDHNGDVTFLNPAAAALTGWGLHEAAGQPLERVVPIINEDTRQAVENPVRRAFREKAVVGLANHTALVARDGREVPVEDSAAPIRNKNGDVGGAVLVFRDVTEARRAMEARSHLAAIVESSDDAIIGHTLDGRIASWNRGAQRLYGYAAGEVVGKPLAVLVPPDHPDELPAILERVKRGEYIEHFETQRLRKDGSRVDVSLTISPIRGAGGKVIGASKIARDITERKRAEAALRASEAQLRQLADAMPQIVWSAGPDGVIDYSNRRWYEFTGLAQGVGNDGWGTIIHPDEGPPAVERWAESLRSGTAFDMEIRLLDRRAGGYRWHLVRTMPVRNDAGAVVRWYGSATDIDGQKRAGEAARFLAEASAALASLVDYESTLQKVANLAVPYFADWAAVDVAGEGGALRRLAAAHKDPEKVRLAQELMRRYPPDPDAPGGISQVFRTGQPQIVEEITDEMLVQGARDEDHLRLVRSLGLHSFICVPLVVSGKALGVLTFATAESGRRYARPDLALAEDLSHRAAVAIENARLYRALREEDERKTEFLALLAHELRNPLAPLRNSLEIMRLAGDNPEAVEQGRALMERQLQHLVRLVDDLLDVSRISRGKLRLRKERITLASVVASALETCQPLVKQQDDELTVTLPEEPVYVDADRTRLAQVLCNLVSNAAKYSDRGSRIWLTARREGGEAVVSVKDTGVGIPPAMLPKIFDLFTQVDRSLEKSQGGLGVGLTIVKRLVEMHGGRVEAKSEGHGLGSEFTIRLPVALSVAQGQQQGGGDRLGLPAAGRRILIADDNADAAGSLAMVLELTGNEVRTARDGLEAVEAAAEFRPDLVLLDIGMPRLNGYDACRRFREQPWGKDAVIVALTGWGQEEDKRRSQEAGFDSHLVKPVEPAALEKLLAGLKPATA
jgi:PAS domain S-box-containing protein